MTTQSASTAERIAALRAKMAATASTQRPATSPLATASAQIQAAKKAAEVAPAELSAVETTLLNISEDMRKLEKFEPQNFVLKLQALRTGIETKAPGVSTYLQEINRNLNQYPELVHILSDEQISVIVSGLLFMTGTNMAQAAASGKSKKPLGDVELEMMF